MKILLDTHALLWMCSSSERLSERARAATLDDHNQLFFSVAGWWEIAIKVGLGKLELQANWASAIRKEMRHNGIEWLPLRPEHCERIPALPFHHRDLFDRLLIAQAQTEGLAIITCDPHFDAYGVEVLW
jgi:PIN domain nuclease of toxin-antitoxin system